MDDHPVRLALDDDLEPARLTVFVRLLLDHPQASPALPTAPAGQPL